jgi:D-sedoheptulose 7-phosphate isomerase
MTTIRRSLIDSLEVKKRILSNEILLHDLENLASVCITALQNDKKILFCGNGGSAADAQHLAAELSGRFYFDRPPLFAEALHVNTSYLTAVGNDYGYDKIFSRLVQAKGREGDVLIGLSTSGNSENIIQAFATAKEKKMLTAAFTGESGGKMKNLVDYLINVPSTDTPRIQEAHITLGHALCEMIENEMFAKK